MNLTLDIPDYKEFQSVRTIWEEGFTICAQIDQGQVIIKADQAGLVSLARHLLTLAQKDVPTGSHIHYDQDNSLEDGSCEIIIEKM
ncbi:MAG TPA: hypothetical protein VFB60_00225 [Ktedonobacteraceae bacterium]|nr:hypothetical protein [Ktedonobacteraceae bacterium]